MSEEFKYPKCDNCGKRRLWTVVFKDTNRRLCYDCFRSAQNLRRKIEE